MTDYKQYFDKNQPTTEREHELWNFIRTLQADNDQYQNIFEDLKVKFKDFEKILRQLAEENQDLKDIIERLKEKQHNDSQLANQLQDYQALQQDYQQLKDQVYEKDNRIQNLHNENQDKQGAVDNLLNKLKESQQFTDNNNALQQMLRERESDLKTLSEHYQAQQSDNQRLQDRINNMQEQFNDEHKDNITKMNQMDSQLIQQDNETRNLREALNDKDREIQDWERRYHELDQQHQQNLKNTLEQLEADIRDKIQREREEYNRNFENQIKGLQDSERANEEKIVMLISENQRQSDLNNELGQEIQVLRDKVVEDNGKLVDFQVQKVMLFIEIERLYSVQRQLVEDLSYFNGAHQTLMQENENLKQNSVDASIIKELRDRIGDLESRNAVLLDNNRELSEQATIRIREIDQLRKVLSALESGNTPKNQQDQKMSVSDYQELQMAFEAEKTNLNNQIAMLRNQSKLDHDQIEKLKQLNTKRREEADDLRNKLVNQSQASEPSGNYEMLQAQFAEVMKELDIIRQNRDDLKGQLDKASNSNLSQLNELIRDSIRLNESSAARNSVLNNSNGNIYGGQQYSRNGSYHPSPGKQG